MELNAETSRSQSDGWMGRHATGFENLIPERRRDSQNGVAVAEPVAGAEIIDPRARLPRYHKSGRHIPRVDVQLAVGVRSRSAHKAIKLERFSTAIIERLLCTQAKGSGTPFCTQ